MTGGKILSHSIQQVFGNLSEAIKISSPIIATIALGVLLLGPQLSAIMVAQDANAAGGSFGLLLLWLAVFVVASLWVAVAWHRYVLLEEYSDGLMPNLHSGVMTAYFGNSLLVGLAMVGIGIVVGFAVGLIVFPIVVRSPLGLALATVAFIQLPLMWIYFRICLILPATALKQKIGLQESWYQTQPHSGAIFTLALIYVVLLFAIGFVNELAFGSDTIPGIGVSLVLQWITMMVGISVMTTLYGHIVEGRELRD